MYGDTIDCIEVVLKDKVGSPNELSVVRTDSEEITDIENKHSISLKLTYLGE